METINKSCGFFKSFDGTPIYYETRGEGPVIVFIYGIACLMNHWHYQVEHFSKTNKVVLFDIRGHHKSADVPEAKNLTINAIAQDLIGLLEFLNIKKSHFVGHSFGAPVILELYRERPDLFASLVFINGFAKNPIKGMFGLEVVEPFFYFVRDQYNKSPDLWNALWRSLLYNPVAMNLAALAGGFNIRLTHFKDIEVYAKGVSQLDLKIFLPLFEELMKFNGDKVLESISCPSLIISGEDDHVTPRHFQFELREKIKGSEFLMIPYGSHCTQLDFPDYVNLRLERFFSESTLPKPAEVSI
jgi:pimeloyl-ACP methyl ester carboxylesterase